MGQWWQKVKWSISRWMLGRYGQDSLSTALIIIALVVTLLGSALNRGWISFISLVLTGWALFRMFSKNIDKRRAENVGWRKLIDPVGRWWRMLGKRWKDRKTHRYFKCPKCGQYLRAPRGKGKIAITCRSCGERFERKT